MFYQEFILSILGCQLQISFVYEDKELTVIRILFAHVLVYVDEGLKGAESVRLRIYDINESVGIFQYHLLAGCGVVEIVLGGEIIHFELKFLDLELIVFNFVCLPQHHCLLRHHLLEDYLSDTTPTRIRVTHQYYIHLILNLYNLLPELNINSIDSHIFFYIRGKKTIPNQIVLLSIMRRI